MSNRSKPPFRAEHVGSLLRPKTVLEARDKFEKKQIPAEQLHEIEDKAVRAAVKRQEDIGLPAVTDGEFRRGSWHMDFLCRIGGVIPGGLQERPFHNETGDVRNAILLPKVVDKLHLEKPIFGEDFQFLKSITKAMPKLTIPAPSLLHGLGITLGGSNVYQDEHSFLADLVNVYVEQVRLLESIGCTYLQIDDTMFATLGDPSYRDKIRTSAGDPDQRHLTYIDLINGAIAKRSSNLTVCVHTCRGNHRSAWVAEGGYDFVAEAVFNKLNVDGFFLEYDDSRSGSFEPLRFVPKKKRVILGLVTSKKGRLESKDELKRRIDAAAKHIDMDQLSLSPQCGFASTLLGNLLTEEEQYAKLQLVVETAREVWGNP
jgi:5-methyltetrahydropteroyltriglutamate--homocysteine methyltransferase